MSALPVRVKWEEYRASCVPDNASDTQVNETRRAFYAGALTAFDLVTNSPQVFAGDEDKACDYIAALAEEITQEIQAIIASESGRAGRA